MLRQIVYCAAVVLFLCAAELKAAEPTPEQKSIVAVDEDYVKAFNAGDAEGLASDFTNDAIYVTDEGKTLKGIDEIKTVLADQFKDQKGATLKLNVYSIEFSADKQRATERGVSTVTTADGLDEPSTYVVEYVRQGDQWRISRVIEAPQAITADHLEPLAWMLGDWTDQSEDVDVRFNAEWSLNRGFINRKFALSGGGMRDLQGVEVIGWDPSENRIRSWYFDSDGGHGAGVWRRDGNSWIEDITGVTPKGEVATATNIFTPKDQDSFGWRTINRCVGGEPQAELPEIVIHRTTGAQLEAARGQL
jgi:uncharacterized protein (TIGR02246 family)